MGLHGEVKFSRGISPQLIIGNATITGQIIDRQGWRDPVEFIFVSGTLTDGSYACKVFAGDNADLSDEAEVTDSADLLGSAPSFTAGDDDTIKKVGYRGSKRYCRPKIVQTGAVGGGTMGCVVAQSSPGHLDKNGV